MKQPQISRFEAGGSRSDGNTGGLKRPFPRQSRRQRQTSQPVRRQYAEQIALTGEHLGNFPPCLHSPAMISAAINLDRALG
jgi:hypothetical protein